MIDISLLEEDILKNIADVPRAHSIELSEKNAKELIVKEVAGLPIIVSNTLHNGAYKIVGEGSARKIMGMVYCIKRK